MNALYRHLLSNSSEAITPGNNLEWIEVPVVGLTYEGRDEFVKSSVSLGVVAFLERQPDNQWDPNAIKVVLGDGRDIGYIPRVVAAHLARDLDAGMVYDCYISYLDKEVDYRLADVELHMDLLRE